MTIRSLPNFAPRFGARLNVDIREAARMNAEDLADVAAVAKVVHQFGPRIERVKDPDDSVEIRLVVEPGNTSLNVTTKGGFTIQESKGDKTLEQFVEKIVNWLEHRLLSPATRGEELKPLRDRLAVMSADMNAADFEYLGSATSVFKPRFPGDETTASRVRIGNQEYTVSFMKEGINRVRYYMESAGTPKNTLEFSQKNNGDIETFVFKEDATTEEKPYLIRMTDVCEIAMKGNATWNQINTLHTQALNIFKQLTTLGAFAEKKPAPAS